MLQDCFDYLYYCIVGIVYQQYLWLMLVVDVVVVFQFNVDMQYQKVDFVFVDGVWSIFFLVGDCGQGYISGYWVVLFDVIQQWIGDYDLVVYLGDYGFNVGQQIGM